MPGAAAPVIAVSDDPLFPFSAKVTITGASYKSFYSLPFRPLLGDRRATEACRRTRIQLF